MRAIRVSPYSREMYEMVRRWWVDQKEFPPLPGMLPEESTFVAWLEDKPAACITVYLTNSKEISLLENLVGNPELKGAERKQAVAALITHAEEFTARLGYQRLMCMSEKDKLKEYYQGFGYLPTLDNITTMVKEI